MTITSNHVRHLANRIENDRRRYVELLEGMGENAGYDVRMPLARLCDAMRIAVADLRAEAEARHRRELDARERRKRERWSDARLDREIAFASRAVPEEPPPLSLMTPDERLEAQWLADLMAERERRARVRQERAA